MENYRFRQKSGNDPNSRGREGGSCSLRHYDAVVRKSVCDSPLTFQSYLMFMVIISSKAIDQSLICRHFLVIYWNIFLFLLTWNNFSRSIKLFLWTTDHFLCNVNFFLTQNCFLCITNFLFWTLFRIFLLSCSNKNRITCQKERNHFHRTQNFFYIQFLNCKLAACWSSSQWSSKQRQLFEKHLWRAQISVKLQAFLLQFFQNEHSNRYFSRVLTRF